MSVSEFIETSVKLLVNEPDSVSVSEMDDRGTMVYSVTVAPNDVGRVIGKDGRVVSSLRQVVAAVGSKSRVRTVVKVSTDD